MSVKTPPKDPEELPPFWENPAEPEPEEALLYRRALPYPVVQRLERIWTKVLDATVELPREDLPVLPEDLNLAALIATGELPVSANEDPLYQRVRDSLPPRPNPADKAMVKAFDGQIYVALRDEIKRWRSSNSTDERSPLTPFAEFLAEVDETEEWFAPGIIAYDAFTQFLGRQESFKSMSVQDLHIAATYGGTWLNLDIPPTHSFYISGEKRRRSIRTRMRRMLESQNGNKPQKNLAIGHRSGLRIHPENEHWLRLVDAVDALNERAMVSLDTITTLAPSGFNENSGESWAYVLEAIRMLTDLPTPATVLGLFHPSKEDKGGVGMQSRGHTSFGGEADGAVIFSRPNRETNVGIIHARPKDGDYAAIPFYWDELTYHIVPTDLTTVTLNHTSMVAVVGTKGPCDFETIWEAYGYDDAGKHRFGKEKVRETLKKAIDAGAVYSDEKDHSQNIKTQYWVPNDTDD